MSSSVNHFNKGTVFILLSAILFGSYGVWSRLIGDAMGPFFQGWTRGLLLVIVLLPLLLYRKEIIPIAKKDRKWLLIFLTFTSATQAPIFYAFTHMDIGSASLLFFATMLLTMFVVGVLILNERITKIKLISFLLAVIGLYSLFSSSLQKFTFFAVCMAVLNGVASGGEVAFSKKLTHHYSPLYISFLSWAIIVPANMVLSLVFGERQILPSLTAPWLWQVCYTVVSFFAFWLVIKGLKYVEASIGGLIGLLEVVFSVLCGILLFGEILTIRVLTGAMLIISSSALSYIVKIVRKQK